ncbi:hypothetical protein EZV62_000980 [Acer yangbiense]|uniref:Cytochrome P450 n=1 Tax=Acer yangbiense TaxID=1000413 RepID=A0A5C7IT11_9ROSI|nr:hypothetical protein EZV62_000980 [Acer yangbiense]
MITINMYGTWTILAVVFALLFFLQSLLWKRNAKTKRLPPGPRGFPIFGCLHLLGKFPHRDLHKLSQKYGPIMHLRLGLKPTVVVSSPQAAELFLKNHDQVFASRPPLLASKHFSYGQQALIFGPYGPHWRNMRKMCTSELLCSQKISSFKSIRKEELDLLIESVKQQAAASVDHHVVDLSGKVKSFTVDVICRMLFRRKYVDEIDEIGFQSLLREVLIWVGTPNIADYIPQIAFLDPNGLIKHMKAISKVLDEFFEKIIEERLQSKDENRTKDFVDVMLGFMESEESEYRIQRHHVKAIMLDMLAAAIDPVAATTEWTLSQLLRHPRVMKKLQKELESVVGLDRIVEESDMDNLEYLELVVKETMRLHPVAPLLAPHESMEDCTVNGFHIPNKSLILVNVFTIGRDPSAWNDPDEFYPERFVGSSIDFRGRDFQLLPFGSGRRACAGIQMGFLEVRLLVAQLVHCFDWELPDGMLPNELDMTEGFSQVIFRANPLQAIPTNYRLNI